MKTVADFKRAMTVGTRWSCTRKLLSTGETVNLGVRMCVLANSVDFGFMTSQDDISYCSWPKKATFSVKDNITVIITIPDFCELKYTAISSKRLSDHETIC